MLDVNYKDLFNKISKEIENQSKDADHIATVIDGKKIFIHLHDNETEIHIIGSSSTN